MNRRQKKKQYKKIHGYNPPKEWQVVAGGTAIKNGDLVITEENVERIAEIMCKGFDAFKEALTKTMEAVGNLFLIAADGLRGDNTGQQLLIEQQEPAVVLATALAERRKKECNRKRLRQWHR